MPIDPETLWQSLAVAVLAIGGFDLGIATLMRLVRETTDES